jgi:muramoyltetrapeptide carboxypeptidase
VLNWDLLGSQNTKIIVGFSDISALQVAIYTRLGWPALHGPVPGSRVWDKAPDIDLLLSMLSGGRPWANEIKLDSSIQTGAVSGILLGGCLSVLTNLIGTPYLPASLSGCILFFEDKNENAGRILRFWNQWLDSGLLNGVSAVVLGRFNGLNTDRDEAWLYERLSERTECPVFVSEDFGHNGPNIPIAIGAYAEISSNSLRWTLD